MAYSSYYPDIHLERLRTARFSHVETAGILLQIDKRHVPNANVEVCYHTFTNPLGCMWAVSANMLTDQSPTRDKR